MTERSSVRVGLLGAGLMARYHLSTMLPRADTAITVVSEPFAPVWAATSAAFSAAGRAIPPNEPDWGRLIADHAGELDALMIITPHAHHLAQAITALEAGLDVYLEKPMTMTAAEAEALIATRDRTGGLLVVGFQGSLSPQVRLASSLIASGAVGKILNVDALVWQDWDANARGTWRQEPAMSGGGFFFDTGAHLLNTVCDLAGEDISAVAAWLEDDGAPVDLRGVVMARLASGALITMNGCGRAIPSLGSDIRVFCEGATLRTGIWGERLEIQRAGEDRPSRPRSVSRRRSPWEQFLAVRAGRQANPSPPEVGLRMARLWDAIRTSSERGGAIVRPGIDEEVGA